MKELQDTIARLKSNKATGSDEIPAEAYKYLQSAGMLDALLEVMNLCMEKRRTVLQMKESIMVVLYKKGSKKVCSNYRTISLLQIIMKILTGLMTRRLMEHAESNSIPRVKQCLKNGDKIYDEESESILNEEQSGFRSDRGRGDAIFALLQVLNECFRKNLPVYMVFIDLVKAYDYVPREVLWKVLRKFGVPDNFVEVVMQLHEGSTAKIKLEGKLSRSFPLGSGLKQGCGGAPCLFDIFFSAVLWVIGQKLKKEGIPYLVTFGDYTFDDVTDVIVNLREFLFADDVSR